MGYTRKMGFYYQQQPQGFYYNQPQQQGFYYNNQKPQGFYYNNNNNDQQGFYYDQGFYYNQPQGFYYENGFYYDGFYYESEKQSQGFYYDEQDAEHETQGAALSNVITVQVVREVIKKFVKNVNPVDFFKNKGDAKKLSQLLVKECQAVLGPEKDFRAKWRAEGSA